MDMMLRGGGSGFIPGKKKKITDSLTQAMYFILFLTSSYLSWDKGIEIFL